MQRVWCGLLLLLALLGTLHPLSASILAANITSDISVPGVWTYTIANDQPLDSTYFVAQFTIAIDPNAPITVTAQPAGWDNTIGMFDGIWGIRWTSQDVSTDLAPGGSLGGFSFSSSWDNQLLGNAVLDAVDHSGNDPNGISTTAIQVDTPIPEPWTGSTVGLALLVGSMWLRKKSRRTVAPAALCP